MTWAGNHDEGSKQTTHPAEWSFALFVKIFERKTVVQLPPLPPFLSLGLPLGATHEYAAPQAPLTRGHNGCDWRITRCSQPSPQLLFVGRVSHWSFGSCWWGVGSPTGQQTNHGFTDELNQGWVFKPRRASYDVSNRHFRKHSLRDAFLRKRNCRMYSTFSLQVFIGNFVWRWNQ